MKIDRKKLYIFLAAAAVVLIAAVTVLGKISGSSKEAADETEKAAAAVDRTFTLKRGDLVLGITQPGTVSAKQKHRVVPQANMRSTIVCVIA